MPNALTLETAKEFLARAEQYAVEMGVAMAFAIVDASGHLVALHAMDGGRFISPQIAQAKAYTAAAFKRDTAETGERLRENPFFVAALTSLTQGHFVASKGGLPIEIDGLLAGAIGASGGTGQQDEEVIRKAIS